MRPEDLLELRNDLRRERRRLGRLVDSLGELRPRLRAGAETVEAAALRLHSFYTGVERALLLITRTVNGGTPRQGEGWHRRLLERMAMATELRPAALGEETQQRLQEYLRFRHLVRNLYSDELRPEPIEILLGDLPDVWQRLEADLVRFEAWAGDVAREGTT
ncbi:MAG: hypothetical protein VKI81_05630 [Synechococcaceae cyanobacterium]|nr:hypothetical protein [Synechococcaceae cyanobacterium]